MKADYERDHDLDLDHEQIVGGGLKARVAALSARRKADNIHTICAAACAGEIKILKEALASEKSSPNACETR